MKKIILMFLIFIINLTSVKASDTVVARIGDYYFDTLEEAVLAAKANDTIILINDVTLNETLEINKTITINLNNNTIEASEKVFLIQGGGLTLSGVGKVVETSPNYGAIMLKGSDVPTDKEYSTITVGNNITLEGWSGIFITHNNNTAYGVVVNMNGTIKAVDDTNGGAGAGIYVNGNIKHEENFPIINIGDTANIDSTGTGIYAAGYSVYNIDRAYIAGSQSGLGIKSGVFNIRDSTIVGYGANETPTSGNNNGINASGAAIQIESNSNYKGNIELNIESGSITSKNSNVIYEYTTNNSNTQVNRIKISGGTYISETKNDVFRLSDSFINKQPKFVSGGIFSSNPSRYLISGYSSSKNNKDLYEVSLSTMLVFANKETSNIKIFSVLLITTLLPIIGFVIYKHLSKNKKTLSIR